MTLETGIRGEQSVPVTAENTAKTMGSGTLDVLTFSFSSVMRASSRSLLPISLFRSMRARLNSPIRFCRFSSLSFALRAWSSAR